MDTTRLKADPDIEITLRRSARARRLSLRVSGLDGRVTLTLPSRASRREAMAFAEERAGWIRAALAERPAGSVAGLGAAIPFEGGSLRIEAAAVRGPRRDGDRLLVPPDPDRAGLRVAAFLREAARTRLVPAVDRHAATLGRAVTRVTLRDPRSRWGSCTGKGDLMFSWRLVMAPPEVLDYVAAHEVAHLEEMNHSPAFWAVVARLCPDYPRHRAWLRREGTALHRFSFGN
jgi:predicted metal-dependent hydrolase